MTTSRLIEKIKALKWFANPKDNIDILLEIVSGLFVDAPQDGNQYARQDGDWAEIVATGGGVQSVTGSAVDNTDPLNPVINSTSSYTVYKALLNQTGTSAPVATILENTAGLNITYSYNSGGTYFGTFDIPLDDIDKVWYHLENNTLFDDTSLKMYDLTSTQFSIRSLQLTASLNGLLNNTPILIEVYN